MDKIKKLWKESVEYPDAFNIPDLISKSPQVKKCPECQFEVSRSTGHSQACSQWKNPLDEWKKNQPQDQVKPEWEEDFSKLVGDYNCNYVGKYWLRIHDQIKFFIRKTLSAQAEEIVKEIERRQKETSELWEDSLDFIKEKYINPLD